MILAAGSSLLSPFSIRPLFIAAAIFALLAGVIWTTVSPRAAYVA